MSAVMEARAEAARAADTLVEVQGLGRIFDVSKPWLNRVIEHAWLGFGPQKNHAVGSARNDWVLCLDADERVSPALGDSIRSALSAPGFIAYRMARRNRFLGRWLKHGEGYPDWSVRLFDRRHARWSEDTVHEHVLVDGPVGRLRGDLLHASAESLDAYLAKRPTKLKVNQLGHPRRQSREPRSRPRHGEALEPVDDPAERAAQEYRALEGVHHVRTGFQDYIADAEGLPVLPTARVGDLQRASFVDAIKFEMEHASIYNSRQAASWAGSAGGTAAGRRSPWRRRAASRLARSAVR